MSRSLIAASRAGLVVEAAEGSTQGGIDSNQGESRNFCFASDLDENGRSHRMTGSWPVIECRQGRVRGDSSRR